MVRPHTECRTPLVPASGCSVVRVLLTDATHAAQRGCNVRADTSRFQGLSEGKTEHLPIVGASPWTGAGELTIATVVRCVTAGFDFAFLTSRRIAQVSPAGTATSAATMISPQPVDRVLIASPAAVQPPRDYRQKAMITRAV